ncbi:accessory gene regulator B family protein [Lapidilactobacillus mulanensis]
MKLIIKRKFNKIVIRLVDSLAAKDEQLCREKEFLRYMILSLFVRLMMFSFAFTLSLVTNHLLKGAFVLCLVIWLRSVFPGWHAKKFITCFFLSITSFVFMLQDFKWMNIQSLVVIWFFDQTIILFYLLTNKNKNIYKPIALLVANFLFLVAEKYKYSYYFAQFAVLILYTIKMIKGTHLMKKIKKKLIMLGLKISVRSYCVWFAYEVPKTKKLNQSKLFNALKGEITK